MATASLKVLLAVRQTTLFPVLLANPPQDAILCKLREQWLPEALY
jgi:hypothetical protein